MSSTTGIPEFFQGLTAHLVAQVNGQAIVATFQVGDGVYYHGSKVADHGHYRVVGTEGGKVTIGHPTTSRVLVVNTSSLQHVADSPLLPLPRFRTGDAVEYHGSLVEYHGYWLVASVDPASGMVNLHCPGADTDRNTLRCRAWSLELAWLDDL